jgi:geranylgeranyl diphosphate synthase type II
VKKDRILKAAGIMALRAGARGMVSGQAADLEAEGFLDGKTGSTSARLSRGLSLLSYIHLHKTADLICAAVEMGAVLGGAREKDFKILSNFGKDIGLCFQVADDILDSSGNREELGKDTNDVRNRKLTYATLLGIEEAGRRGAALMRSALGHLAKVEGAPAAKARLAELAGFIYGRDK